MNLKFDKDQLKDSRETPFLVVDVLMVILILVNLSWIVFDTLFSSQLVQESLYQFLPRFTDFYATQVHPNFILYDLFFVYIYLTELGIRWVIAIRRHTYHRWWFFPFIHWYDVLGCIPVGSFRWLRLLRVIAIVYRLERANIIDLSSTLPGRFVIKYSNVIMEEISNRVVVNMLSSVQNEIKAGTPVLNNIVNQVVRPRIPDWTDWLLAQIDEVTENAYVDRKEALRQYIDEMVVETFAKNYGVEQLKQLPRVGEPVAEIVAQGVSQLIFDLAEHIVADVGQLDRKELLRQVNEATESKLEIPPQLLQNEALDMVVEALEVIKDEARVQKWKQAEQEIERQRLLAIAARRDGFL